MEELLSTNTVGLAVIVALMILHLVLPYVRPPAKNGSAGEQPTEFWRNTIKNITNEQHETHLAPILHQQTKILASIETMMRSHHEASLKTSFVIDHTQASLDTLRTTNHQLAAQVQRLVDKCPLTNTAAIHWPRDAQQVDP